ncbi:MAG: nicotinate-nucleotide--dimethylbenzimidazole phosphoribosyltransferase [Hyphomicrobiales bacterium]|nr:nicotinate-nucleotide--dimethylbenzimidazole phosphoribosyltransferase [Hyphomicrobiales bacterium]
MFATLTDFYDALHDLPPANEAWRTQAREHQAQLTKPLGALGRLEECAIFLAGWGDQPGPHIENPRIIVFAGNHGVTARGVSPFSPDVTAQMVANFAAGGAAVNALAKSCGAALDIVEIALERPTGDISRGAAMSEEELLEAVNAGALAVSAGGDLLALGEMGIGNTTIAAALAALAFGGSGTDWAGAGTGLDAEGVAHKARVLDEVISLHSESAHSAADMLRLAGGRETAAIAGAILAACHRRVPVVLDGYVAGASLAPLYHDNPSIINHCIAAHCSAEFAHRHMLNRFGLRPLLDLDMRLGEGTGAALAISILKASVCAHNEMATFAEARVANRKD